MRVLSVRFANMIGLNKKSWLFNKKIQTKRTIASEQEKTMLFWQKNILLYKIIFATLY